MNPSIKDIAGPDKSPAQKYNPESASHMLKIAESYLKYADRLIYSFGSKTFLSGYDLFDSENHDRGNIDCSTFVLLVLAGIPYEESPYHTGKIKPLSLSPLVCMDFSCFHKIPERYITIAERIGRPYLSCPKGLDMEKAASMGISKEQLLSEIHKSGASRRSVDLANYFLETGCCFTDSAFIMPGDLVFFRSDTFFKDGDYTPTKLTEVTHVGIIYRDTDTMINSSGYLNKERAKEENLPAVSISPLKGKRIPLFYARPAYR